MTQPPAGRSRPPIEVQPFGTLDDGRRADVYQLRTPSGILVQVTNYGGIVTALRVPDRTGSFDDIVLGYDRLEDYVRDPFFFGATIGRYANRIAEGRFRLREQSFSLERNNGPNHLHGGSEGFHKALWAARPVDVERGARLELRHLSPDGHGGYPGNLDVTVAYTLSDLPMGGAELRIEYHARSDRDTIVNLTHHSYFNLSGDLARDVLDHDLVLRARRYTPVNAHLIPTGELRDVAGTAFDFTKPALLGARIDESDEQLVLGGGYDHNWVLDADPADVLAPAARIACAATGRVLEVRTTEPGIQVYTGNSLADGIAGKSGVRYGRRSAFCLETQHFPDSPNKPHFPTVTLRASEPYSSTTVYAFTTIAG
jgi:aldose 1-epimerase